MDQNFISFEGLKRSNEREPKEVGFEITTAETATAVATLNQIYSNGDAFERFDDITQLHSGMLIRLIKGFYYPIIC